MVKKQQFGGLITSLFNSGGAGRSKEVLPCPSTSSSMLSAASSSSSSSSAWNWASCGQPRTLSFRQEQEHQKQRQQDFHKTMNSAYSIDYSCFSSNSVDDGGSFSESEASGGGPAPFDDSGFSEAEAVVISALQSERLFFEPDASSSCIIIEQAASKKAAAVEDDYDYDDHHHHPSNNNKKLVAFGGARAMSLESQNPYRDFRESMEAVVMSHGGGGVKDWRWLEEMLGWYLSANCKTTHGLIVGAFVDLLVSLSNTSPAASSSPAAPPLLYK